MKTNDSIRDEELDSVTRKDKETKKSEAKTDAAKKDLLEEPGEEKFEGTMRQKDGEKDQ